MFQCSREMRRDCTLSLFLNWFDSIIIHLINEISHAIDGRTKKSPSTTFSSIAHICNNWILCNAITVQFYLIKECISLSIVNFVFVRKIMPFSPSFRSIITFHLWTKELFEASVEHRPRSSHYIIRSWICCCVVALFLQTNSNISSSLLLLLFLFFAWVCLCVIASAEYKEDKVGKIDSIYSIEVKVTFRTEDNLFHLNVLLESFV